MDPLGASNEAASLAHALEHAGHLLPAQGPLSVFIHHNTLHAFEHLPFHEAVTTASRLYETEPYFTEARFRDLYAAGRITDADLDGVLERWWQATPPPPVGPFAVRSLHRMALHNPIACETAAGLVWQLTEGDAGHRFRSDVPQAMRLRIIARSAGDAPAHGTRGWIADDDEARAVALLWAECRRLPIADSHVARPAPLPRSHRDALLALTGEDANDLVHPVVGRLAAAFLDEGTASWALPARDEGFFRAWCTYVAEHRAPTPTWQRGLRAEVAAHVAAGRDAGEVVLHGLHELGVAPEQFADYLTRVLLHLRGWAGMFHWFEERPQEAITIERQVRLMDFLAVRLTYDRFAWRDVARRQLGPGTDLAALPWRTPARMDERGEVAPGARRRLEAVPVRPARRPGRDRCRAPVGRGPRLDSRPARSLRRADPPAGVAGGLRGPLSHRGAGGARLQPHTSGRRPQRGRAPFPGGVLPRRARGVVPASLRGARPAPRDVRDGGLLRPGHPVRWDRRRTRGAPLPGRGHAGARRARGARRGARGGRRATPGAAAAFAPSPAGGAPRVECAAARHARHAGPGCAGRHRAAGAGVRTWLVGPGR